MLTYAERLYEAVAMSGDTLLAVVQSVGESDMSTPRSLMALNLRTGKSSMEPLVSTAADLGLLLRSKTWTDPFDQTAVSACSGEYHNGLHGDVCAGAGRNSLGQLTFGDNGWCAFLTLVLTTGVLHDSSSRHWTAT